MLTAALRDLHRSHPGQFETDVRTSGKELWLNNPHLTPLDENSGEVEVLDCHYPLIHESNQRPVHFLHGFVDYLNQQLRLNIQVSAFKGDIHLSPEERTAACQLEAVGWNAPFWIIVAGGKYDFTVKWWDFTRWQKVVDHFRGRIQFAQVGANEHFHPKLEGAIDLRGRTTLRELVRLMHHAQGVVCPVTFAMHLAAAVPTKDGKSLRPCVVVAGGREPAHWEAYPGHQFIHTIGALPCCQNGGCWKARTLALGDGDPNDSPYRRCLRVKGTLPECMDMIPAEEVIRRIEMYFQGGACEYLQGVRSPFVPLPWPEPAPPAAEPVEPPLTAGLATDTARPQAEKFIEAIQPYPGEHEGRGIVVCGGGFKYFPCAWVCINMLRRLGCKLPIQLWHYGPKECDAQTRSLVEPLGVECVDALEVRKKHPANITRGWPLKPYAIIHSSFREVLYLDADNVPVVDPEFLFDTPPYLETGAIFWPDYKRLAPERAIWKLCGVEYQDEPEFESGQIVVDKQRCWKSLQLTMWYNEHADFFYEHIHGDKDTFHMAWRKLGQEYSMPKKGIHRLPWVMCQHDFEGRRIFQHRNLAKWSLYGKSFSIYDFKYEKECKEYLNQLQELWKPELDFNLANKNAIERAAAEKIISTRFNYHRIGHDQRPMSFQANGVVGEGAAGCETFWDVKQENGHAVLEISSEKELTCRFKQDDDGVWKGRWETNEQMPIHLEPGKTACAPAPVKCSDILFRGPINAYTGYGLHSHAIIAHLETIGQTVRVIPHPFEDEHAPVARDMIRRFAYGAGNAEWELFLNPPDRPTLRGRKTVFFTMWEATRLPAAWVNYLNAAELIVVPCRWNEESFRASGVTRPMEIVPLGIKEDVFHPAPMNMDGPCVFGTAGRMVHGGKRKGLHEVIAHFQKAFPTEPDVRLRVKCFPDCGVQPVDDPRVEIAARFYTEQEMAEWYASLTCFVSVSRSEGWGLMPHQAMAVGRPCIAMSYGGQAEFLNEQNAYCVKYKVVPAAYNYADKGVWAEPNIEHLVELMRHVHRHRGEAREVGLRATKTASVLTWKNSNTKLEGVLRKVGMIH